MKARRESIPSVEYFLLGVSRENVIYNTNNAEILTSPLSYMTPTYGTGYKWYNLRKYQSSLMGPPVWEVCKGMETAFKVPPPGDIISEKLAIFALS